MTDVPPPPLSPSHTCEKTCDKISPSIQLQHIQDPFLLEPGSLPVFITMSVCIANAHWMCKIQQEKETRPIHGGLVQIGERLAPERPLCRQKAAAASTAETRVTRHQTYWRVTKRTRDMFLETDQDKCLHMVQYRQTNQ